MQDMITVRLAHMGTYEAPPDWVNRTMERYLPGSVRSLAIEVERETGIYAEEWYPYHVPALLVVLASVAYGRHQNEEEARYAGYYNGS